MTVQYRITRILSTLLLAGLCSAPLLRAQQTNPATPQQAPETSQQPQQPAATQPAQASPTQTSPTQPATTQPGTTKQRRASPRLRHRTRSPRLRQTRISRSACAVRDNGESVASAAESGDYVS